ncbi:MAG: histone deacetylase, partial [Bacillota bacterium]|nr:histone deacetylase [Bacillota bacterium]
MNKTGLVFDESYLLHETHSHPECKERLIAIKEWLKKVQLYSNLIPVKPESISDEVLAYVHPSYYSQKLASFCNKGGGYLDPDTFTSVDSYRVALLAAGGAVKAVEEVVSGRLQNCVVLGRPPGHHASEDKAMGFCLLNNVAIAARFSQKNLGLKRIMIIDWDAHHGNGTEKIFYNDPGVLFFSIHESRLFPGTGFIKNSGENQGLGYNINIPVPKGSGDYTYRYIFDKILIPVIKQYRPELILISAGFDGYYQDELAGLEITSSGFKEMTQQIMLISEKT